jgi:hypothetical protein
MATDRWRGVQRAVPLAAVLLATLAGGPARAADDLPPAIGSAGGTGLAVPSGGGLWQVSLGARTALFRDAGYDPFSENDAFVQLSLSVMRALHAGDGLGTAVGLSWDDGDGEAGARGTRARLSLSRLAVVLEERFVPRRGVYLMARVAPGALRGKVSVQDPSVPAPLSVSFSGLSVDASAGAAVRLTTQSAPVGVWLMGDSGYGWAATQTLALRPALATADQDKAGTTSLGTLAPRGAFFRFSVALSY